MPTQTISEFGQWAIGLAGFATFFVLLITAINQTRKLFTPVVPPPIPQGKELVTSAELDRVEQRLKTEIQRVDTDNSSKVTKLQEYCRERFHELADKLQEVELEVKAFPLEVRKAMDAALLPVLNKLDTQGQAIAALKGRLLDGKFHDPDTEQMP